MLKLETRKGFLFANFRGELKNQKQKYDKIKLLVDTGAFMTIIAPEVINQWGYSVRDMIRLSKVDGAYGYSEGYVIEIPSVKCLGFEFKNFKIACHDLDTKFGFYGLLGMDFFNNFRMDINFQKGIIHKINII